MCRSHCPAVVRLSKMNQIKNVSTVLNLSIIPSHAIAQWLQTAIDKALDLIGLGFSRHVEQIVYFIIIIAISIIVGWTLRRLILWAVHSWVKMSKTHMGRMLVQMHTFTKCSHFIPPLVFLAFVPFAFDRDSLLQTIIMRASLVYAVITFCYGLIAVLTFIFTRVNEKANMRNLPTGGVLNLVTGLVWLVAVIVSVSIAIDRSPAVLLTGLTAFAAVLMLVFKDTILGFVAGIQMAQNDMLHVGDWIVVPDTDANGVVEYVSLSTVKVRNFDNTIITVPPYTLVSKSFQNWRGMTDSGVRRVCYTLCIAPASVVPATSQITAGLEAKYPILKQFASALKPPQTAVCEGGAAPWNGSVSTNLGLFRAYLVGVLLHDEHVSPEPNLMVNLSNPTADGLPMQIYYFVRTTDWVAYEGLKSTMMERIVTELRDFGLQITELTDLSVTTVKEA